MKHPIEGGEVCTSPPVKGAQTNLQNHLVRLIQNPKLEASAKDDFDLPTADAITGINDSFISELLLGERKIFS